MLVVSLTMVHIPLIVNLPLFLNLKLGFKTSLKGNFVQGENLETEIT